MDQSGAECALITEDDVGASLAVVEHWPFSLAALLEQLQGASQLQQQPWTLLQLAPVSSSARSKLNEIWVASEGRQLIWPRQAMASGGNGAVLVHRRAVERLTGGLQKLLRQLTRSDHLIVHPWGVRPVADKWIYGSVPANSVYLCTFPLFCLDAGRSSIHQDHVNAYHAPSKAITLEIWKQHGMHNLLNAQEQWDQC